MNFKEIDPKTMKKLHEVELEILKEFKRICEKNNLRYFAVGGTLIGTIKYQSFIPWDDDVDIGMPREDYEKFLSIGNKEIKKDYFIQSGKDYKTDWVPFIKIRKKYTIANEQSTDHIDYPKGIFIDVFPYDEVPKNDGFVFKLRSNIIRILVETVMYKWKIKKLKDCRRKIFVFLFSAFSKKQLKKMTYKLMTLTNNKGYKYMTSFCGAYTMKKETHLKSTLLEPTSGDFEDIKINIPKDSDKFLKQIYGNYHEDPPKEKRVNHSMVQIVFDTRKK